MKTNSKNQDFKRIVEKPLSNIRINKLSKDSGFYKRKPQKISAKNLIISFLITIWGCKHNTYSTWASKLGQIIKDTVSRQAIAKRVNKELVVLLRDVLQAIILKDKKHVNKETISGCLKLFKRILIEDSTSIHLEDSLSKDYPSINKNDEEHATMKIQTLYEVTRNRFINFDITSFRDNDQSYAKKIMGFVKSGDLVIRDLGYFILGVLKKLSSEGVYFISLLKKGVYIFQKEEEIPIDLAAMLKKRGILDIDVFLGKTERTPVRLIATPVDQETASIRRMKAKKDKNHGWGRSRDYLFLLGWTLIITNITKEQMSNIEVYNTYSLRWRIEIIFKSWKSCLGITKIPNDANKIRLEAFIYCMLIYILLFQVHYYNGYAKNKIHQGIFNGQTRISLIKLMQFIVENVSNMFYDYYLKNHPLQAIMKKQIAYYCRYESRNDRLNFGQYLVSLV